MFLKGMLLLIDILKLRKEIFGLFEVSLMFDIYNDAVL